jgi:3-oxoacyl-[acyl-carrier-protein] synthase II
MRAYITANGIISPQETFGISGFPDTIREEVSNRLLCSEPDYKVLINPIQLRRMPRIIKMGLASAKICITRSADINPDAIIVGTGLGCLDNLEKFLTELIDKDERVTSVLPFINSTHNAVGAQIAMLLQNHGYNFTYCHRSLSFESALLDALLFLEEKKACHVLAGGIDESTSDFVKLQSYLGYWKEPLSNLELFGDSRPGTIAGEGSAFFMLSANPDNSSKVAVDDVYTFLTPQTASSREITSEIGGFLAKNGLQSADIDLLMTGMNGDRVFDAVYHEVKNSCFPEPTGMACYKHLCGEYYTSSAFALWLSSVIISTGALPHLVEWQAPEKKEINRILLYNHFRNSEHALILMSNGSI